MITIHKHIITDRKIIEAPKDSKFLSVGMQGDNICIWVMSDTGNQNVSYTIRVVGTGQNITELWAWEYLGTVQAGEFVWHIFY
jgi:hypothetical protein